MNHEGDTAVVAHHQRHRSINKLMAVSLGFFGAVAPILAAYISYRQAKVEASTDNQKTSKEAESGYNALKNYSEALKRVTADQDARIAENTILVTTIRDDFQRQIDDLKAQITIEHDHHHHHIDDRGQSSGTGAHPTSEALPPPPPPPPTASHSEAIVPLPKTLKDAANTM